MSVINIKEEEDKPPAEGLTALNGIITKNLVPLIINKDDLITLFTSTFTPINDALEKSEKMVAEARPSRINKNPE